MFFYKTLTVVSLYFLLCVSVFAQRTSFIPAQYYATTEAVYQFNFHKADSLLNNIPLTEQELPWFNLAKSNYFWWMIVSGEESKEMVKEFDNHINLIITALGKQRIEKLSNEDLYIIANGYAFKTRLALYKGNYIAATGNLNNCIKYIEASLNKENQYEAFFLTGGLYNYFVDFARNKYPITRPYLATLPKGSVTKGFTMLYKIAVSKDWLLNNEANYFLGKLFQETEKNYVMAEKFTDVMVKRYPNNLAYIYNHFDVLLKQNKKEEAQKELIKINVLSKTLPNLTPAQRSFYLNKAQNDLKNYYKKNLN